MNIVLIEWINSMLSKKSHRMSPQICYECMCVNVLFSALKNVNRVYVYSIANSQYLDNAEFMVKQ